MSSSTRDPVSVKVAVAQGEDKFQLLDQVIRDSDFIESLKDAWKKSGKSKEEFLIAVKPNLMMLTHLEDPVTTYTEPNLIEHLIDRIRGEGFSRVRVVDAQNIYGNWYQNRSVRNVARVARLRPEDHGYEIADLTEEMVPHDFGGKLGDHYVGRAWRDANYRISFAKNKTHVECFYTLTLKNIYGTLPKQNKALEYHATREWDESAFEMLRNFPVNFGFIDAYHSADGLLGFKGTTRLKTLTSIPEYILGRSRWTKMMIASPNLIAADFVGSRMMGLTDPLRNRLTKLCVREWGQPQISQVGFTDTRYVHPDWNNVMPRLTQKYTDALACGPLSRYLEEEFLHLYAVLGDLFEEGYLSFNLTGLMTTLLSEDPMDPKEFPLKALADITDVLSSGTIKNLHNLVSEEKRRRDVSGTVMRFLRALIRFRRFRRRGPLLDRIETELQALTGRS